MTNYIGIALLAIAALIACGNFYVSFVRPPIYWWVLRRDCPNVTGIPAIGTFLVLAAFAFLQKSALVWATAIAICVIDTAGLPWFCLTVVCMTIRARRGTRADAKRGETDPGNGEKT
jgi:hypothetical protein